ncbi:MAG: hypothetical protein COV91_02920 [Candidatus Taylorbacteria bacterium CG11_big_fil_rev_8_21_14_0_20_46_11]|uniref:LTD domain-containing protein n=1 Tax=Candidatus Taylorbacteria bacterium CG11_big_fil_rev_8_21_14_0_20_46_11 TaxID=1975025 RepID=A0A2H0KBL7_9BACT|nr:MAG: hypothetical protein COV91_02920 [Candidatus Taylorbacteria bacterium CG11_big_fil_rev_8_21_14_0_20_46_11]
MRRAIGLIILGFIFVPNVSIAGTEVCTSSGYTVLTVNGIFTNESEAKANKEELELRMLRKYNGESVRVDYLHNPSHLLGVGDLVKVLEQTIAKDQFLDDYDLYEILKSASEKVTTQKLLLVAHSQGNFYANGFYKKVANQPGGVPSQSLGVYSVATPASYVAGDGKYLTSGTDKVITPLLTALSPNDYIELHDEDDPRGHGFAGIYLKYKGADIVKGIEWSLDRLQTNEVQKEDHLCIEPPDPTVALVVAGATLAVGDFYLDNGIDALKEAPKSIHTVGVVVLHAGTTAVTAIGNATIYVATKTVQGVSAVGTFVLDTSEKVVSATLAFGKSAVGAVANAFSTQKGQTASVANANTSALTVNQSAVVSSGSPADSTKVVVTEHTEEEVSPRAVSDVSLSKEIVTNEPEVIQPVTKSVVDQPVTSDTTDTLQTETTAVSNEYDYNAPSGYFRPAPPGGGGGGTSQATPVETTSASATPVDTTAPDAPVVNSPSANASFTTTSATFTGTAEVDSVLSNDFSSDTVSVDSSGAWTLTLTLNQGTNTVAWYASDRSGNRSVSTSTTVHVDSLSPEVTLSSSTCDGTLSASACLVATTSLAFSWNSGATDFSYFVIDKNGTVSTTTATSTTATATDESTYTMSVSAIDTSGNASATSTQAVSVYTMPVVINEVAWAGTEASAFDEWVELYNRTDTPISLSSFVMYATDLSPYIPLSGTIGANSYFLIERTDDTTVDTVSADLVTPFSGAGGSGLSNDGDALTLAFTYNGATTTVDSMPTCPGGNTSWCTGDSTTGYRRTTERISASATGNSSSNWASHLGEYLLNGLDANGGAIKGTPKAKNSVSHLVSVTGSISSDVTLTVANSPYLIGGDSLTVTNGATLTIEPGVVIKGVSVPYPAIQVNGALVANGTASEPVVFTSFYDDEYGGDLNADGTATTPSAGNWVQLSFNATSVGSSLTHTLVRYGGSSNVSDTMVRKASIGVDRTKVAFDHVVVEYSRANGISLVNSNSTVTNSRFSTSTYSTFLSSGIYISGGSPTVTGSTFNGNYRGMTVASATSTISSNTFIDNTEEAIYTAGVMSSFSNNAGSGNKYNAIVLSGNSTSAVIAATTTLFANALPYLVKGTVTVASNSTLAFDSGVVVKGWNSAQSQYGSISVANGGTLYSSGTTPNDLIFTSIRDSSVGGAVTSGDPDPAPGDWKGVAVLAGGRVSLSGFTMKYAGAGAQIGSPAPGQTAGAFKITGSTATSSGSISNALFDSNYQSGLNLDSVSSLSVSDVTFQNHTLKKASYATGIYSRTSTSTMSNITFSGNERDGVGIGVNALTCTNCGTPNTSPSDFFSP